jgi:regulatory protein
LSDLQNKARKYAVKLLSYKGRSRKELEERLKKKGFNDTVTSSTIRFLNDSGLINDLSLAETLKREALSSKMLSQTGAKRFILARGIPQEIIDRIFSHDEDIDAENAARLMDKKKKSLINYPPETARRRLYNLLLRRGYSYTTIMKALKENKYMKEDKT